MKRLSKKLLVIAMSTFLLTSPTVIVAQNKVNKAKTSLVTKSMAEKIAYSLKYFPSDLLVYFNDANGIKSLRESDKVLANITQHYDCVERFITRIIEIYGIESGWIIFDNIGYTPNEYDIAERIYKDYCKKRKSEDVKKQSCKDEIK